MKVLYFLFLLSLANLVASQCPVIEHPICAPDHYPCQGGVDDNVRRVIHYITSNRLYFFLLLNSFANCLIYVLMKPFVLTFVMLAIVETRFAQQHVLIMKDPVPLMMIR